MGLWTGAPRGAALNHTPLILPTFTHYLNEKPRSRTRIHADNPEGVETVSKPRGRHDNPTALRRAPTAPNGTGWTGPEYEAWVGAVNTIFWS